jgi:hypothetical protein
VPWSYFLFFFVVKLIALNKAANYF